MDLSYNKLMGTYDELNEGAGDDASLVLEVNRLSGWFPSPSGSGSSSNASSTSGELNALRGNLFSCQHIPDEDVYSEDYTCGSEDLELSLYSFISTLGLAVVFVASLLVVVRRDIVQSSFASNLAHLFNSRQVYISYLETAAQDSALFERVRWICVFSQELGVVSKMFLVLLGVNLATCLPIYGVKLSEYGVDGNHYTTHSYQYRWTLSIAYVKGNVPAVLLMLMWASVICVMAMLVVKDGPLRRLVTTSSTHSHRSVTISSQGDREAATPPPSTLHSRVTYSLIFLLNAAVAGSVNGLYIYYSDQALSPATHLSIQLAVALFKVGWNMAIVPLLAKPMKTSVKIVAIELIILVFNNILIPSLVTAFTSPACFQVSRLACD